MDDNLKKSMLPQHLDEVQYHPLGVNLDYSGFVESLERASSCTHSIAVELARIKQEINVQSRSGMIQDFTKVAIQQAWYVLVALDRAFSAHVLALNLDPTKMIDSQMRQKFLALRNQLTDAAKRLEPFIAERWQTTDDDYYNDPALDNKLDEWSQMRFNAGENFKKLFTLGRVIDGYLIE